MRNMTLDDLDMLSINILVNLYEKHSATFVAQQMNIPAPKVSRCLQHARVIFNNPLFIRKKHGLIPNEFTRQLYPIAKELVQCSLHLYQLNELDNNKMNSAINIFASDMLIQHFPQQLSRAINDAHLPLSYKLHTDSDNIFNEIKQGRIDLAILSETNQQLFQFYADSLDIIPLMQLNHLYLVCGLNHPLLKQEMDLETIASYPYLSAVDLAIPYSVDPFLLYCQQHKLLCQLANIDDIDSKLTFHEMYQFLADNNSVTLLPYNKVFDQSNLLTGLHVCCLSETETKRLYLSQSYPTLYLVKAKGNKSNHIDWLTRTVTMIIKQNVH